MQIRGANIFCSAVALCIGSCAAQPPSPGASSNNPVRSDSSTHKVQLVTVDEKVQLEVLDWGGPNQEGVSPSRSLILLAGLGNTAHVFDNFAPKLAAAYHVYGITRRGYGASSAPEFGYSADRLGDDVLAVIEALKIDRPVLVGNGLAGEELSSVGSRHAEKVAGLIYLDAAYHYAYYDRTVGDLFFDLLDLEKKVDQAHILLTQASSPRYKKDLGDFRKELEQLQTSNAIADDPRSAPVARKLLESGLFATLAKDLREEQGVKPTLPGSRPELPKRTQERKKLFDELLQADLPGFEKELRDTQQRVSAATANAPAQGLSVPEAEIRLLPVPKSRAAAAADRARQAILQGRQKYTRLRLPILAIYCIPHQEGDADQGVNEAQAKAFAAGVPMARVVRLANASNLVFLSNEADVLREMNAFLSGLK